MMKPQQQPTAVFRGHTSDVMCLRFHPRSQILYSGDLNGQMIEWNTTTRRSSFIFTDAHKQSILQIHALITKDESTERYLCSQGREGELKCWDLEKHQLLHSFRYITSFESQQLSFCKFSMLKSLAALPHSKNVVAIHEVNKNEGKHIALIDPDNKKGTSSMNRGMLMSLFIFRSKNECSDQLLCGMENGEVLLYDLRNTSQSLRIFLPPQVLEKRDSDQDDEFSGIIGDPVLSLTVHGENAIVGTTDNTLSVLSLSDETPNLVVKQYSLNHPGISDMVTAEDHEDKIIQRLLCTAGWDFRVRIFDLKRNKPLALYKYHTQTVNCVDIQRSTMGHQEGCLLASGSKDNRIALWPLAFKEKIKLSK